MPRGGHALASTSIYWVTATADIPHVLPVPTRQGCGFDGAPNTKRKGAVASKMRVQDRHRFKESQRDARPDGNCGKISDVKRRHESRKQERAT